LRDWRGKLIIAMYTTTQAARKLGIHPDTLRQYILAGRVKAKKLGTFWIISEKEVQKRLKKD